VSEDESRDFDAETKDKEKRADPDIFRREEHQYSA
jgi:phosphoribosylaminoimidazole-succinocarboxamide synthase